MYAIRSYYDLPKPELGITAGEAAQRFDRLQMKLARMWGSMREMTDDERSIVVVPSQSIDFDIKGAEIQAYEERVITSYSIHYTKLYEKVSTV